MNRKALIPLAGFTVVLLGAGIALLAHREHQQSEQPGTLLFPDLTSSLDSVSEIRLSKGDGSRTTLKKQNNGWTVVERQYPADGARVRELLLGLTGMKVIEAKTSDPANYAKLGVEAPDSATAGSTLVEVVAGQKTWPLIVGHGAEGRSLYVRKPAEKASALVEPSVSVDPDQKRWIDRQLTDLRGDTVHDISVKPASGPAYLLTRAKRGDTDLALSPVPKGRTAASAMVINGQADALTAFHFDDVRAAPATPPASVDHATFRTFDGQVFELTGHKDADKAYVAVNASRDAALAAQFPEAPADKPATATPATTATSSDARTAPAPAPATDAAKPAAKPDQTAERLAARAKGLEYEIPLYKYESIFKPLEDLLEKKPGPAAQNKAAKK
jgi:hypothetical protein